MKNKLSILSLLFVVIFALMVFAPAAYAAGTETITLSAWGRTETLDFQAGNMVPGDAEVKEYCITVNDRKAIALRFSATINEPDSKLSEVLFIRVELDNTLLYDGLMAEMPTLSHSFSSNKAKDFYYTITVYLDTSVTNEYMGQKLTAEFQWALERKITPPVPPVVTTQTTTRAETTTETTTAQTTTETETTVETTTEITTVETVESTTEVTTTETTVQTTLETTTHYEETTASDIPPVATEPCCECCVGYGFPYSCNLWDNETGCDLPWCCAGGGDCACPWCWIIPLTILVAISAAIILIFKKMKNKNAGGDDN